MTFLRWKIYWFPSELDLHLFSNVRPIFFLQFFVTFKFFAGKNSILKKEENKIYSGHDFNQQFLIHAISFL
jgi:hypothetical protein